MTRNCSCISGIQHIPVYNSAKIQTSHGAIQGFTGLDAGDSAYQVITQASAAGQGSEQSLLKPCIDELRDNLVAISPELEREDVLNQSTLLTDSGFHSEDNFQWLDQEAIGSYIADNQYRKTTASLQCVMLSFSRV